MKKWGRLLCVGLFLSVFISSVLVNNYSYANENQNTDISNLTTEEFEAFLNCQKQELAKNENASQIEITEKCQARTIPTDCNLEGAEGWFMCPLIGALGTVSDSSYNFIKNFLKLDVELFKTNTPTYQVWKQVRNIANVGLVILFLMIILSQLTGYGISNYSLKKMLPRIIMATILINFSFIISQFLVDISNILGSSIVGFFNGLTDTIFIRNSFSGNERLALGGSTITIILLGIMTVRSVSQMKALYSIVIPMIVSFLMIIITTGLLLVVRKTIAIVLVVVAPIAFLSLIFPNLESGYKFWKKGMSGVLVLFPIVGLLFGGAGFVSTLIINSQSTFLTQILGVVTAAIPLVFTPTLVKNTIASLPLAGQMASNFLNKISNGAVNKAKNSKSVAMANLRHQRKNEEIARGNYNVNGGALKKLWYAPELARSYTNQFLNTRTKSGQAHQYDLDNQQASTISSLADQISDQDIGSILSGNFDFDSLSDTTKRAVIASGYDKKNYGEMVSAALLKKSKLGEANEGDVTAAIAAGTKQGFNQNVINKIIEQSRQSSEAVGRSDINAFIRGLQKEEGGASLSNALKFGSDANWRRQTYKNHLGTMGAEDLTKVDKNIFDNGDFKLAVKELYDSDPNFNYVLNSATKDPNMSATVVNGFKDAVK